MRDLDWVVFFSQTGSEIVDICYSMEIAPKAIITNKTEDDCKELRIYELFEDRMIFLSSTSPKEEEYLSVLQEAIDLHGGHLITLHGYLRILPSEVCSRYRIVNGHPGLITHFPALKGKDPQVRAFEQGHSLIGCVLHDVIAEVDAGKIIDFSATSRRETLDETFEALKGLALTMWCNFLKEQLS